MIKTELKNIYELDKVAREETNGVYVVPSKDGENIRIRELIKCCEQQSKDSYELSEEELKKSIR